MKPSLSSIIKTALYLFTILGLAGFSSIPAILTAFSPTNVSHLLNNFSFLTDEARFVFLIILLLLMYHTWVNYRFKHSPISILSTDITLRFLTPDGSDVRVFRTQTLCANHPHVTAHYSAMTPKWGGKIEKASIDCQLTGHNEKLTSTFDVIGNETTGWELIQRFEPFIPYTPIFPFVPTAYLNENNRIFSKYVLKKTSGCNYINDFNAESPEFNMRALQYTHHKVKVTLLFADDGTPKANSIRAQLIHRNGIRDITPEKRAEPTNFVVRVSNLRNDRLHITWRWPDPTEVSGSAQTPEGPEFSAPA